MTEENLSLGSLSEDESQSGKESKKRIPYVSRDLKSMEEFVAKVNAQLGHTAYHSNKAIAAVHGLSPDSIKPHLSAAQQYKLLEIKFGVGYKVTEQFQKLFLWKTESERRSAIIECLKSPETYQQLFKDYEYHVVPFDGVKNHFIRSFGFKEDVAAKAAQIFLENLKEFDLLNNRGVLISALPPKPDVQEVRVETEEQNGDSRNIDNGNGDGSGNGLPARQNINKVIFQSELDADGKKTIPIYLIGNKQALFVYPDDITEDDIELVKHQIEGVLLRIQLESKRKAEAKQKQEN